MSTLDTRLPFARHSSKISRNAMSLRFRARDAAPARTRQSLPATFRVVVYPAVLIGSEASARCGIARRRTSSGGRAPRAFLPYRACWCWLHGAQTGRFRPWLACRPAGVSRRIPSSGIGVNAARHKLAAFVSRMKTRRRMLPPRNLIGRHRHGAPPPAIINDRRKLKTQNAHSALTVVFLRVMTMRR